MDFLSAVLMTVLSDGATQVEAANIVDFDETETLVGVDSNENGLRDDFERMLRDKVKDEGARNILYHMLTYMQKSVDLGATKNAEDSAEVVAFFNEYKLNHIFQCLPRGEQAKYTYIDKKFANTPARKSAYQNYNNILRGKITFSKAKVNCEEYKATLPNYIVGELKD